MNKGEYLFHLDQAIARRDVEALVGFWSQSRTERFGKEVRERITESIPYLAKDHHIPYVVDNDNKNAFRDFVLLYDKIMLDRECGSNDANDCLTYFIRQDNQKGIERAIENDANNWYGAIKIAAKSGNLRLVQFFWERFRTSRDSARYYSQVLSNAAWSGKKEVVVFLLERMGANSRRKASIDNALAAAVRVGSQEIIDYLIEQGANAWGWALEGAAYTGRRNLVHFFLDKGANPWFGFNGAVDGGHLGLVEFFIAQGANNKEHMDSGLYHAALRGRLDFIDFFLERGADDFETPLKACIYKDDRKTLDYLLDRIPPGKRRESVRLALQYALKEKKEEMAEYLESVL